MAEKFENLYKKLNSAQKEAVSAIEGPVMVVAGPGTGKTQVLTLRIANILRETDTEPENILALTFTESGAISMRRRLSEIIGSSAYSVNILTFHGFCNGIIKDYPEYFPRIIGSQNITEVDQIKILEEVLKQSKLDVLKPFGDPFHYLNDILASINKLKQEGVPQNEFVKMAAEERDDFEKINDLYYEKGAHKGKMKGKYQALLKKINKNEELSKIYAAYQKKLESARLYDYGDMIMEALAAISENKDLLLTLQERYQYILVDEHQDTNNAQNKILELLCNFHQNPNIFIVGDDKQAIYRFQGASLQNFLYFRKLYSGAKLITLKENYRSTQSILDIAESLLKGPEPLISNIGHPEKKMRLFEFSKPEAENYFLGKAINEKISEGIKPEEIAVLYRENRDAQPIARTLEKFGIPFAIESKNSVLDDPDIRKLVILLKTADNFGAQDLFIEAMHVDFLGIDILDAYKLVEKANRDKTTIFQILKSAEEIKALNLETGEKLLDFFKRIKDLAVKSKNKELASFFEEFVRETGFLSHILSLDSSAEELEKLNRFFDEIKSLIESRRDCRLKDFLDYLATMEEHGVSLKTAPQASLPEKVRLMTAHSSKGQEFDVVFIVDAYDGHWGNKRRAEKLPLIGRVFSLLDRIEEGDQNEDERRLFYVALTRARKEIMISYAKEINGKEQLPSQFLTEISEDLIEKGIADQYENEMNGQKVFVFLPPVAKGANIKSKEFIKEIFLRNGLSVTGLNNYLSCPWRYFYTNLIRIPKTPNRHQLYGIAVHAALKDFFTMAKERGSDKKFLLEKYEFQLRREPLTESEFEEFLNKGKKSLGGYYDYYGGDWNFNALPEVNIKGAFLDPEIRLTGKIDKIEFLGPARSVNVVDYKTGRPKTRGEIEGSTKNSEGDIKRQLVFYKLLLDLWKNGGYEMVSGDVDFIEPDLKGNYHRENFLVGEEDVSELKTLIRRISGEIIGLEFWDRRCDKKECEFCALRELMEKK